MDTTAAPPPLAFALPLLPRSGARGDSLSPNQRRLMVAAILAAHVAGVYGLMQLGAVREAMREAAPMFVDLIAPPAPPTPPAPQPQPQPVLKRPPPPAPVTFVVPPPPPPEPAEAVPTPPLAAVAPPAPPAAPQAPMVLPPSAVQYLDTPPPEYPRLSRRNNEAGRVIVRVFIDEAGMPRQVQLGKSSGFERLDASALAAVLKFRFKPPTENGLPISGWANVPVDFGLEK